MIAEADRLSFRYRVKPRPKRGSHPHPSPVPAALDGISFAVPEPAMVGLLGPNGSGKSTLFRILATMIAPGSGSARILGMDTAADAPRVREQIGVVFQEASLDRKLTVRENLRFQGNLHGLRGAPLEERVQSLADRMGLSDRLDSLVESLSGGLRRRVEIVRGLLHQPRVLLLDEPSTGLDPAARQELWMYLADLHRSYGYTVIAATHYLEEAEACQRVLVLDAGRIVADGTPEDLKRHVQGDVVVVDTMAPAELLLWVQKQPGVSATALNGAVRAECPDGPSLIAALMQSHPRAVKQVQLHKPSLEDVYFRATGRSYHQ